MNNMLFLKRTINMVCQIVCVFSNMTSLLIAWRSVLISKLPILSYSSRVIVAF